MYFKSDEAENAATAKIVERYAQAKAAKVRIESELRTLGEKLEGFGKALARPAEFVFLVTEYDVTVGSTSGSQRRPIARIEHSDADWQRILDLISAYEKARNDKCQGAAELRAMGVETTD